MKPRYFALLLIFLFLAVCLTGWLYLSGCNIAVLNPKGLIAAKQSNLIQTATWLMLLIVVPVLIMTFVIAYKYRAKKNNSGYRPDWDYNFFAELLWWGLPCAIIFVLSIITWFSSHSLDPFRPLESDKKPLTIQVIALEWKWLFIYPEQKVACVNMVQFPVDTPVVFEITGDAPMNSFWIPQLAGQIYAMPGMRTKLNLLATATGSYQGSSANLSGEGFSGMRFQAKVSSEGQFIEWIEEVKKAKKALSFEEYKKLALPSQNNRVEFYTLQEADLMNKVIMGYMLPMDEKK
jgi:cytochrome o ubiquinol oxidase subunit 2